MVVASGGYPDSYRTGLPISGLGAAATNEDVLIFHAGTKRTEAGIVTSGGRVLTVVGRGSTFSEAIDRAYGAIKLIGFDGMYTRTDIGRKALALAS